MEEVSPVQGRQKEEEKEHRQFGLFASPRATLYRNLTWGSKEVISGRK